MASTQVAKKIGPCGGGGGQVRDMNANDVTRIVKISVRHGWSVDSITVRYLRNGREESTPQWGGQGGNLQEIVLQETEHITSVKGHYGNFEGMFVVRSLKFETSLGKNYGPYGREEGVPFELHAVTGQIVGFHARSGRLLDAIGIYVKAADTTGGSNTGGNTGGSIGTGGSTGTGGATGTPGSWTSSDTNFWDRPAGTTTEGSNAGGNTGGAAGTPGSWTPSDTNFWDRPSSGA